MLRRGLRRSLEVLGALLGAALAVGALGLLGRPEAWAAGPRFVLASVLVGAGTAASAVPLGAALLLGWLLARDDRRSGEADARASLGLGGGTVRAALLPTAALLTVLAAVSLLRIEPASWSAVHALRGSPAATAVALGRLERGEVVGARGGALAPDGDALAFVLGAREGRVTGLAPDGVGWRFADATLDAPGGRWEIGAGTLRPIAAPSPPASPLAHSTSALLGATDGRARRVLHRRLALLLAAPLLLALGWGLGGRAGRSASLAPALLGVGLFGALRLADRAAQAEVLGPESAGWLPVVLLGVAAWWAR